MQPSLKICLPQCCFSKYKDSFWACCQPFCPSLTQSGKFSGLISFLCQWSLSLSLDLTGNCFSVGDSAHVCRLAHRRGGGGHGCQMAIARFLDRMCLALRASGLWLLYATLQNLIPSFPWIAPGWRAWGRNPRKGRDQILPSGNTGGGPGFALQSRR